VVVILFGDRRECLARSVAALESGALALEWHRLPTAPNTAR
jgi:hypothetical protein